MRALKIERVMKEEDPMVTMTYMQITEDKLTFDCSITISEGEFIAL